MRRRRPALTVPGMPLWMLTIAICVTVWVLGSVLVALGATWLVRREPD